MTVSMVSVQIIRVDFAALSHLQQMSQFTCTPAFFAISSLIRRMEALGTDHGDLNPNGAYAYEPTTERVVFPVTAQVKMGAGNDVTVYEERLIRYALAWHVGSVGAT